MTRYEQGFINKCAEYGMSDQAAGKLLKTAKSIDVPKNGNTKAYINGAAGALFGGAIGAALDRKKRLRGLLLGVLGGGAIGYGKGFLEDESDYRRAYNQYLINSRLSQGVARNREDITGGTGLAQKWNIENFGRILEESRNRFDSINRLNDRISALSKKVDERYP